MKHAVCFSSKQFHAARNYLPLGEKKKEKKNNLSTLHSKHFGSLSSKTEFPYVIVPNLFYQPSLQLLGVFYTLKGHHFIFRMLPAEGQKSSRFLDLLFTGTPGCFVRQWGAESSLRPWSLWTGSVALIAQVADQIKESTVMPQQRADGAGCHWLKVGGRQGRVSVQSVISIPFISPVIWWILLFYSPWSRDLY